MEKTNLSEELYRFLDMTEQGLTMFQGQMMQEDVHAVFCHIKGDKLNVQFCGDPDLVTDAVSALLAQIYEKSFKNEMPFENYVCMVMDSMSAYRAKICNG